MLFKVCMKHANWKFPVLHSFIPFCYKLKFLASFPDNWNILTAQSSIYVTHSYLLHVQLTNSNAMQH